MGVVNNFTAVDGYVVHFERGWGGGAVGCPIRDDVCSFSVGVKGGGAFARATGCTSGRRSLPLRPGVTGVIVEVCVLRPRRVFLGTPGGSF